MASQIMVVSVDKIETSVLTQLCTALARTFGRECRIGTPLPSPDYAYNPHRKQYVADPILKRLHPGNSERVLGVVDLDLYVPDLNFVFGLADRFGRRAVIALPRLRQSFCGGRDDETLFSARIVKEAVHELGHTYGLGHCRDRRRVMAFSNSLMDTDYKNQEFCPRCQEQLGLRIARSECL